MEDRGYQSADDPDEWRIRMDCGSLGLSFADISGRRIPDELIRLVPSSVAHQFNTVPVALNGSNLILAFTELDYFGLDSCQYDLGRECDIALATPNAIKQPLANHYGSPEQPAEPD